MRIRRNAKHLLGSGYFVPQAPAPDTAHSLEPPTPPPPTPLQQGPCLAPEASSLAGGSFASSSAACGETCELSRSPWDLIADLSLSDPQVVDDVMDEYLVSITCRASWLFPARVPVAPSARKRKKKQAERAGTANGDDDGTSQPPHDLPKKAAPKRVAASKKESSEPKKKLAKVKKEEEQEVNQQSMYKCKKNDGKRWHCRRQVSHPDTLCNYHFYQKRAYLDPDFAAVAAAEAAEAEAEEVKEEQPQPAPPAASKPAAASKRATPSISKPRKKRPGHDAAATEGFYYYAGFGPFRSKRQYRSSNINNMNEPAPSFDTPKKEEEEEDEPAADDTSNQQAPNAADADSPRGDKQASAHDQDASSCDDDITGIAGGDEVDSSEEDETYRLGVYRRRVNGNGGERKNGGKRWRKPVKARSLKSLM